MSTGCCANASSTTPSHDTAANWAFRLYKRQLKCCRIVSFSGGEGEGQQKYSKLAALQLYDCTHTCADISLFSKQLQEVA